MELISYAQNFEDIRLWRAFRDVERGRYLDIGTQDPVQDSVSRLFYDMGWRGVHVEPTPRYADAMRKDRPDEQVIEAAVSYSQVPIQFFEFPDTGLSTGISSIAEFHQKAGWTSREILVPTITLASLFEYMGEGPIHWMKIDVEGMEADVLSSWGDHPARPLALVIEATKPNTQEPTHHDWYGTVTDRGYQEVLFDGLSRYFIYETESHRGEALTLSPNVFDNFKVLNTHWSAARVAAEAAQAAALERKAQMQAQTEQLAEVTAVAADATMKLESTLQHAAELESRIASEAELHAQALDNAHSAAAAAQAEIDAAQQALRALESRRTAEADENAQALAQAHAVALAASAQLDEAMQQVAERDGELATQAAAHNEAIAQAHAEATEAAALLDDALQRVEALEKAVSQQAETHARNLAEAHAATAAASAQLETISQRASTLENQIASDAANLVQARSEAADAQASLDDARRTLTVLQSEIAVESAAHAATKTQALAAAAELGAKLDLANARVQELQLRIKDQGRLHKAALDLAKERGTAAKRALAETTAQLVGIRAEYQTLGRAAGRLDGKLEALEQRYTADMVAAAAREQDLRDRLDSAERELAAVRALAADLRAQIAVQIARSEAAATLAAAEKTATNKLLDNVRQESRHLEERASGLAESLAATARARDTFAAQLDVLSIERAKLIESLDAAESQVAGLRKRANQLSDQAEGLTAALTSANDERDALVSQLETVSQDRKSLVDALESTKQRASDVGSALEQVIEGLRKTIASREARIAQLGALLASVPDPLGGNSGLRRALARLLIGPAKISAIVNHQDALSQWQLAEPDTSFSALAPEANKPIDCGCSGRQERRELGALMIMDERPITSVEQLLELHDHSFISAAYRSILGRAPDAEGERHYLARLRSGVHKLEILGQIRRSTEGRAFVPAVAGLDHAIRRNLWARRPFFGLIVRLITGADGNSASERYLRVVANELGRLNESNAALVSVVREIADTPCPQPVVTGTENVGVIEQFVHALNEEIGRLNASSNALTDAVHLLLGDQRRQLIIGHEEQCESAASISTLHGPEVEEQAIKLDNESLTEIAGFVDNCPRRPMTVEQIIERFA